MIVAPALLARLTAGAEVCGRVTDCVIDVGRACARKHLPRRLERAAAAKVVAGRNSQDVDSDGCYTERWNMMELGELSAAVAGRVTMYLNCVETSEAAEDMSRHGYSCDDVCENIGRGAVQDESAGRALTQGVVAEASESMLFLCVVSHLSLSRSKSVCLTSRARSRASGVRH